MGKSTTPRIPVSAAILAGGAARRMGGAVKPLLEVGGRTILDRLCATLSGPFAELLLVAKEPEAYQPLAQGAPWRIVLDGRPERSSLTGIATALSQAACEHVFITAGDTPLLRPELLAALLGHLRPEDDVVLPVKPDGYFEPLCAIYSRRCLPHILDQLARQDFKIIRFFPQVRVSPLPVENLLAADPGLVSFQNANTPEELCALRRVAALPDPTPEAP